MKITQNFAKWFENDQKAFGTKVALQNLLWSLGAELLHDAGVKNIKTTYRNYKKKK